MLWTVNDYIICFRILLYQEHMLTKFRGVCCLSSGRFETSKINKMIKKNDNVLIVLISTVMK